MDVSSPVKGVKGSPYGAPNTPIASSKRHFPSTTAAKEAATPERYCVHFRNSYYN